MDQVIIKTECMDNCEQLVNMNGLRITPYHPIINWKGYEKHWCFPISIVKPQILPCKYIYNLVHRKIQKLKKIMANCRNLLTCADMS